MSAAAPAGSTSRFNTFAIIILCLIQIYLIAGSLAGWDLPLLQNERFVLIAVFILGQVMCGFGMRIETFSWSHPTSWLGILLGVLLYIGVLGYLFGLKLPFLNSDQAVILYMAALMSVKVFVDAGRMFVMRRNPLQAS